ncbi:unnamed protein product [Angiostrongylus costaricensis]|uniref:Uncharacterized protein n=1 Tax=Angiostrongylus costaricensis TaxID=334426 RepID=A0A0R3PW80_ANGCS|nr:unnamed protein product [Angiostrongylus costaricensis]
MWPDGAELPRSQSARWAALCSRNAANWKKLGVPSMLEPAHVTLIVNSDNSSAQVMTATCVDEFSVPLTSRSSGVNIASTNSSEDLVARSAYMKKVDPRQRRMTRITSHTLLYVPEYRRTSDVSGASIVSCPCTGELNQDINLTPLAHPPGSSNISPTSRRKSVQTGAPAIGFRPLKTFERRASQPTLQLEMQATKVAVEPLECKDKTKMLTKRVSWLSMKSLQESEKERRRTSSPSKFGCDSRTASQYGSQIQLYSEHDIDSDTPPLDTLSWSNAGNDISLGHYYEYDNVTLMYAKHEKIPMKDFGSEIRATMDIDHLLNKAVLLLDLQETSLEEIFAK